METIISICMFLGVATMIGWFLFTPSMTKTFWDDLASGDTELKRYNRKHQDDSWRDKLEP